MKILLFGGTGHLGKKIAYELKQQGYEFDAIVRNRERGEELFMLTSFRIPLDITSKETLFNVCKGYDVVISCLGKSVSLNDRSKPTFNEIDFIANSNILNEAIKSGVKKFVYVSALHSEKYLHLEYFKVHHEFSEKLKTSGLNYSIIKPTAIFSAFIDIIAMAKKGQLMTMGKGDKKTNPIYEGDLAKICVDSIKENNIVIEAGGNEIYSRKELNEIIQRKVNPHKTVRSIPTGFVKLGLPFIKFFDRNTFDKFAFFTEVMEHDVIAPQKGSMKFEEYLEHIIKN